jgi:hypothetical protein
MTELHELDIDDLVRYAMADPESREKTGVVKEALPGPSASVQLMERIAQAFANSKPWLDRFGEEAVRNASAFFLSESSQLTTTYRLFGYGDAEELINSMPPLFEHVFSKVDVEPTCYMWWDAHRSALGGFDESRNPLREMRPLPEPRHSEVRARESQLRKVAVLAMARILEIESNACRASAIHGLGHLWLAAGDEDARSTLMKFRQRLRPRPESALGKLLEQALTGPLL